MMTLPSLLSASVVVSEFVPLAQMDSIIRQHKVCTVGLRESPVLCMKCAQITIDNTGASFFDALLH